MLPTRYRNDAARQAAGLPPPIGGRWRPEPDGDWSPLDPATAADAGLAWVEVDAAPQATPQPADHPQE